MAEPTDKPLVKYLVTGWVKRELLTPEEIRQHNVAGSRTGAWIPLGQYSAWSPRHAIKRAQAQPWDRVSRFRATKVAPLPLFD